MSIDNIKQRIQALLHAHDHAAVSKELGPALEQYPEDADLWMLAGMSRGLRGDLPGAEKAFRHATDIAPAVPAAWENLGRAQMLQGSADQAESSYRKSIELNPDNPAPYLGLGELLRGKGDYAGSLQVLQVALSRASRLAITHNQLGATLSLAGQTEAAVRHYTNALEIDPSFHEARLNLVKTLRAAGRPGEALPQLEQFLQNNPSMLHARYEQAAILLDLNRWREALDCYRQILELDPVAHMAHVCIARILMGQGEPGSARYHLDRALAISRPDDPDVCAQYAEFYLLSGERDLARQVLAPALEKYPDNLNVALAAAQVVNFPEEVSEALSRLENHERSMPHPHDTIYYLLSRLYERSGRYDEAFEAVKKAHASRGLKSDLDHHLEEMDRIEKFFTAARIEVLSSVQYSEALPIFIVGMPRSGTTLAEQILASHPDVFGAGETTRLWQLIRKIEQQTGKTYPEALDFIDSNVLFEGAGAYLEHLQAMAPEVRRICDKLPHNFLHLGLIQALYPNATIIYCRRNALDNCLSIYMHRFNINHRYAQDLADLGRYYIRHVQLMEYWQQELDMNIHVLDYERLVADQEGVSRRLLAAAGLEWDDACLRFFDTRRTVVTPSHDQVRQPLYRSSVQRWKQYEEHLRPLVEVLLD